MENIEKRLLSQLPAWPIVKPFLESACILFHRPQTRKRFKRGLPHAFADDVVRFRSGPPVLEGGRVWGVVSNACEWFLDRRRCIQQNYHQVMVVATPEREIDANVEDDGHADFDQSVHINKADVAFMDNMWWSGIALIHLFAQWLSAITFFLQGCPCHPRKLRDALELRLDRLKCPLRGCWAGPLANGALSHFGDRMFLRLFNTLDDRNMQGLSAAQRSSIIDQFRLGKEYSFVELSLRTKGWQRLPLRACGMADHDEDAACDALLECLAQFEALSSDNVDSLTFTLFGRDGPLRAQVLAVATRQVSFSDAVDLKRYRDIMQFLPVLEISVERLHAVVSSRIRSAPNHSPAYTSVQALRKHEIIGVFNSSQEAIDELTAQLGQCRSPENCLSLLGLSAHPDVVDRQVPHDLAVNIIYRASLTTQFQELDNFAAAPPGPPGLHPFAPRAEVPASPVEGVGEASLF